MKEENNSEQQSNNKNIKPIYFCSNCHHPIKPPAMLKQANIQGNIKLACGNCKKGFVINKN